jgi:ribose-phosphate pyrophosphokinase
MIVNNYPDGSTYVNKIWAGVNNSVFRINSYLDLWILHQTVDAYYNYFKSKPTITIPNLIDAQADRRFNEDESFGLKLVCDFLNKMPAYFKIFHPHNPEIVEALIDNVEIIDNTFFIKKVLSNLSEVGKSSISWGKDLSDSLILMSSDAGGFKPLMKLCDNIGWRGETASASKFREYKDEKTILTQLIAQNDFRGKDILIIDDISIYGGTFKGLSKLLKTRNCGKLYLAVSHMTVQYLGKDPVTNYFDEIFTSNSKYKEYFHLDGQGYDKINGVSPKNLTIINLF